MDSPAPLGHKAVYDWLIDSFNHGTHSHAYLLLGPAGVGKTSVIEQALEYMWCQAAKGRPCGSCSACKQVQARSSHPDLWWVARQAGKQDISIDQVRELKGFTNLASLQGSWRAVVIEAADNLNAESGNALLKVLEEPLGRTVFFLTASEPKRLLPTVRSRCFVLHLGLVPGEDIKNWLAQTHGLPIPRANELAHLAGGRPGVALTLARHEDQFKRRLELAQRYLDLWRQPSWIGWQVWLNKELSATDEGRGQVQVEVESWLDIWLEVARDLVLAKLKLSWLMRYDSLQPELTTAANKAHLGDLIGAARLIRQARRKLAANANLRLTLEWLALALPARG